MILPVRHMSVRPWVRTGETADIHGQRPHSPVASTCSALTFHVQTGAARRSLCQGHGVARRSRTWSSEAIRPLPAPGRACSRTHSVTALARGGDSGIRIGCPSPRDGSAAGITGGGSQRMAGLGACERRGSRHLEEAAMRRDTSDLDERFAAFVREHGERHLRVAVLLTGDWHAAEDLVQASLVKLYRAWPRLDTSTDPDAYLRRIVINTHRSWWRARWRRETPAAVLPERASGEDIADRHAVGALVQAGARQAAPAAACRAGAALLRGLARGRGRQASRLLVRIGQNPCAPGFAHASWAARR